MNYQEYREAKNNLNLDEFLRFDCMNIYKSLEDVKNEVVADRLTKKYKITNIQYQNLSDNFKHKTGFGFGIETPLEIVKNGVVYTLKSILNQLKDTEKSLIIPEDVYPVYKTVCNDLDIDYKTYTTYFENEVLAENIEVTNSVILITYPNKPTDNNVALETVKKLVANNNILIFDCVYLRELDSFINEIMKIKNTILIHSLSKTFLEVKKVGFVINNTDINLNLEKLSKEDETYYNNLLNKFNRNEIMKQLILEAWDKVQIPKEIKEQIRPQETNYSYFRKCLGSVENQLHNKVLVIPPSIYDVTEIENKQSYLITVLLPISDYLKTLKN